MPDLTLFDLFEPPKPRAKPRVLMHVVDAGPGCPSDTGRGYMDNVKFKCKKCGHESEWLLRLMSDAKRGEPCPVCNEEKSDV